MIMRKKPASAIKIENGLKTDGLKTDGLSSERYKLALNKFIEIEEERLKAWTKKAGTYRSLWKSY